MVVYVAAENQLGKNTWPEDEQRERKMTENMLMNLTWGGVKEKLLPNNLTMRDSFTLLGPFMEADWKTSWCLCLPFLFLSHKWNENANSAPITRYDMLIHTCVTVNPPRPRHTAHIPPHALPHNKEVLQGFTWNSYYHEDGPFRSTIHLN